MNTFRNDFLEGFYYYLNDTFKIVKERRLYWYEKR